MKNIILATDFSSNAHIAAICAGEITCRLGGRLVILHALPPLVKLKNKKALSEDDYTEEGPQRKLDILAKELHSRFGISVSRLLKPGFAEEEIIGLGKNLKAGLVVAGAQGENHHPNRILGSVAKEILLTSSFPVVCVPPEELFNFDCQITGILSKQQQYCNGIGLSFLNKVSTKLNSGKNLPIK